MTVDKLDGSLVGYFRAEQQGYAAYGLTEKEVVQLVKQILRRTEHAKNF